METAGPDYIDYWQNVSDTQTTQTSSFGIRVHDDHCSMIKEIDGGRSNIFGTTYQIPLRLDILPTYLRMIIDSHLLSYPTSDLMDVLTGEKSFQDASVARTKMEVEPETGKSFSNQVD